MFGDDFVGYGKPQSSALAQWLGGKERLGDHGNLIRRDSHAAIEKGYADILPGVDTHAFAADVDGFMLVSGRILVVQCIPGIVNDVQKNLLNLLEVRLYFGKVIGKIDIQTNAFLADLGPGSGRGIP